MPVCLIRSVNGIRLRSNSSIPNIVKQPLNDCSPDVRVNFIDRSERDVKQEECVRDSLYYLLKVRGTLI